MARTDVRLTSSAPMRRILLPLLILWAAPLAPPAAAQAQSPSADFFAAHREAFMRRMGGGIAILTATPEIPRNDDAGYPYRQGSNFWYLTGFEEPEAVAVLRPDAPEGQRYVLFVRPRDPEQEVWTGRRAGVEGARRDYGADLAYVTDSLATVLPRWIGAADRIVFDESEDHPWAQEKWNALLEPWSSEPGHELTSAAPILGELRLFKSDEEIAYMQRAIDITTDAQRAAMAAIRPGMYEYEAEALIEFVYRSNGSPRVAFNSIVGSGPNSTTLHYEENQRRMEDGDMVVMDIGAEWNYYAADVTRTVPVSGRFTPEQRAIYQIVLDAQKAAMETARPGITIGDVHRRAAQVVAEGLIRVGILSGTLQENLRSGAYERFFMHGTSHWIGLDVHDVGAYQEPGGGRLRVLAPGMVFSVEPGIYIPEGAAGVDPKWWNIGVRIEDDVLVTPGGYRNLSEAAPREIDAIEALMTGRGLPDVVPGD